MLAIRMQRTGRKGYPMYRVIVQEAHRQPTSGKVVANLGSYNPHTKESTLNKEKAILYLKNGAQPSDRVVKLLQAEKIELPKWVAIPSDKKQKSIKNAEKLRKNQPEQPEAESENTEQSDNSEQPEAPVADSNKESANTSEETTPTEEAPSEEKPAEESETPTESEEA